VTRLWVRLESGALIGLPVNRSVCAHFAALVEQLPRQQLTVAVGKAER
jgi:hypothetical protein